MAQPTADTKLGASDIHTKLHNAKINVKAFGATGDSVTNDAPAIQAAIDAAAATLAAGVAAGTEVHFPTGTYQVSSTLVIPSKNIRYTGVGAGANRPPLSDIRGSVSPLISKTDANDTAITFENLTFQQQSSTGTCVSMSYLEAPSGFYNCTFLGHIGLMLLHDCFNVQVQSCQFRIFGGAFANSIGLQVPGHAHIRGVDVNGYKEGIRIAGPGQTLHGGRIEQCYIGINCGVDYTGGFNTTGSSVISGYSFEACDTAIAATEVFGLSVINCGMFGNANGACPTVTGAFGGNEQEVVKFVHSVGLLTLIGVTGGGTLANGLVNSAPAGANVYFNTFIGCQGPWGTVDPTFELINCADTSNQPHIPVIARASLPAAAAAQDGRVIIDDNGAGDRNLMIYAGGQRFRIDGGAAI